MLKGRRHWKWENVSYLHNMMILRCFSTSTSLKMMKNFLLPRILRPQNREPPPPAAAGAVRSVVSRTRLKHGVTAEICASFNIA